MSCPATPANQAPEHLRGIVAKIQRAEEHFVSLHNEILAYLKVCGDSARHAIKIDPHQHTIRLHFNPIAEPDPKISIIIGDFVHNLRSSLDHVWKRLGEDGNFPLFSDIDVWKAKGLPRLANLPPEVQAIIDALQPCHLREDASKHPLAILNNLWGIDKHEAIHLTRPQSVNPVFSFRHKGSSVIACVVRPPAILHDDTEVIIGDIPPGLVEPGMDVDIEGKLFVSLKAEGPWALQPIDELLGECLDFVKRAVVGPLGRYLRP